ncbi:NAD kinase [Lactiplantibacillus plantarum]|uniref:NAD kinase n=1 Tax=Lactiplantibacillus plantarum TaxID=1590 RepID=UPI000CDE0F58|nr:NAD kinase [Lactiplantibacillus plantarum]KAF1284327.1 NAD kinase [Lactiplantibacillus plantarum]MDY8145064.1 NAD kinase [Lactiplantibacillus plantarum]RAH95628.1 NAD kinase [Lactiplantibacillus plantarum]
MKVTIFANASAKTKKVAGELHTKLLAAGFEIDDEHPDIVLSVGGDGTLLAAFHHYSHMVDQVRFVGVHTGHLGFYTDWRDYEIDQLINGLLEDNGQSVTYPLLAVDITYADTDATDHYLALNESTLKKLGSTMVTDVYIQDELFERFRGDGLCVSTPTGSTAYNKSVGGAVIHPRLDALQMAEIASINNRVFRTLGSPVIVAPYETITIRPQQQSHFVFTADQMDTQPRPIEQIRYSIANRRIAFAQHRHNRFWQRVGTSFIGLDEQ